MKNISLIMFSEYGTFEVLRFKNENNFSGKTNYNSSKNLKT